MRCVALLLGVLFATPLVGCAKKTARNTGGADVTPDAPAPKAGAKKETPEKPTWLDPKPKDGKLPVNPTDGDGPWVQNPPVVPNGPLPPAGVGAGQPGGTTVPPKGQAQLPVVQPPVGKLPPTGSTGGSGKLVTKADMNEVWVFTENSSQANGGNMPRPELIIAALVKGKAPAADLVKSGDIILTGTTRRESVWAFERKAPTQGGWIASQNGPEEVTAAEFARRIKE